MVEKESSISHLENINSQKQAILTILKEKGYRITNQRKLLISTIFDEECTCCKEIYYKAHKKDSTIGIATVYRMLNTLEDIGAIDRRNLYRLSCKSKCGECQGCTVLLENKQKINLSYEELTEMITNGLKMKGYIEDEAVENITLLEENCIWKAYG